MTFAEKVQFNIHIQRSAVHRVDGLHHPFLVTPVAADIISNEEHRVCISGSASTAATVQASVVINHM